MAVTFNNKVAAQLTVGESIAVNGKILIGAATAVLGATIGAAKGIAVLSMEYASKDAEATPTQKVIADLIEKPLSEIYKGSENWGYGKATTFHLPSIEEIMAKEEAVMATEPK